ncbi:tRNA threonylcarbamoyladenosine dehydratase [bacterium]|nr:tRNA threonylcarbamoyladenosine dehydratase [bacterium]
MPQATADTEYDPALFERTIRLYGADAVERFARSRVVIVGIGGVGSFAAEALARTAIGQLVLIDSDVVEPSNFNRQLWAVEGNAGRDKVAAARDRLEAINPALRIDARRERCTAESVAGLLAPPPDFVVDAIDSVEHKAALVRYCIEHRFPIISCMGGAGRTDPTRVRCADISKATSCPLAKSLRRHLKEWGIVTGLPVVFSLEHARGCIPRQPLPSCAMVPAAIGLAAAAHVCAALAVGGVRP